MILMTDGMNSWNSTDPHYGNRGSTYSPFGYFANGRLGYTNASNWRAVMDKATLQACTNAKNAGVQIYTVGFSVPSDPIDPQGLNILLNCATKPSMYYAPTDGNALIAAFQDIANQMSGLRLTN